jgi:hypothetical protein
MRTIEEINQALNTLWRAQTFPRSRKVYAPMQYLKPKAGSVVFVGMNPSFSAKGWKRLLRKTEHHLIQPGKLFVWPVPKEFDLERAHEIEALARKHYDFFRYHHSLANALKFDWEHLDLFAYRETSQAKVKALVLKKPNAPELNEFGAAQFSLFVDLLRLARPRAVVVANALAAQIYLQQRTPRFDLAKGCYLDSFGRRQPFPVFFSGMLTGARALDRFSRQRLFWQLAAVLGKSWRPPLAFDSD